MSVRHRDIAGSCVSDLNFQCASDRAPSIYVYIYNNIYIIYTIVYIIYTTWVWPLPATVVNEGL